MAIPEYRVFIRASRVAECRRSGVFFRPFSGEASPVFRRCGGVEIAIRENMRRYHIKSGIGDRSVSPLPEEL
jgi:hypothetical protein